MDKQRRFQKQTLDSKDYKGMEQGAKILKAVTSVVGAAILLVANKDNLKNLSKGIANIVFRK